MPGAQLPQKQKAADVFHLTVERQWSYSSGIGGSLYVGDEFLCYTLELPWVWNQNNVSCIPLGRYPAFLRYDKPDGWRIQLKNVQGRSGVQIHVGNYPKHIKGCVLVGMDHAPNAVFRSQEAYAKLKEAFYGGKNPIMTPSKDIWVEFTGIQSTPWGDWNPSRSRTA